MIDFKLLANDAIRQMTPYQPGKPISEVEREFGLTNIIKLASNENPLGPSKHAIAAAHAALEDSHIYPDGSGFAVKQKLAEFLNIYPTQITLGNGSENILEIIVKAYLNPGYSAVISQYAFLTILLLIKASGAKVITVPADNYGHDYLKMVEAIDETTRIVFIVNPNNPTGTYLNADKIHYLLKNIPPNILIVLDEAYNEYITDADYPDTVKLLDDYPNLIISRTFSKVYGLAAIRFGYAISSNDIADMLNRARLPFNVNSIASSMALAALMDQEHVQKSVELNSNGREQLESALLAKNFSFISEAGNFITLNVEQNGLEIYQALLQEGVIVRPLNAYDMPNFLRITIGTYEQNERFLNALFKILR